MIWAPYFEHSTIISNTCVVRYAYICADVAIIEDYCYARCLPVSPAAPYYRCSQPSGAENLPSTPILRSAEFCVRCLILSSAHFREFCAPLELGRLPLLHIYSRRKVVWDLPLSLRAHAGRACAAAPRYGGTGKCERTQRSRSPDATPLAPPPGEAQGLAPDESKLGVGAQRWWVARPRPPLLHNCVLG
eukprot:COSAG06_NODE_1766_length_8438_cov_16.148099_6_plen_189_part_00